MNRSRIRHPAAGALFAICAAAVLACVRSAAGQEASRDAAAESTPTARSRPRVGLALSGGSARGFAHVGVIEVLETNGVPIDAIAGTSMGSVIGGLRAAGLSSEDLRRVAAEVDWDRIFSDAPERRNLPAERKIEEGRTVVTLPIVAGVPRLPSGIIPGQRITLLLTGLTWNVHPVADFRDLPIPFAAVATDAETGEAVVLDGGFLPDAIRASLAIPSVFAPVEIDGRYLIDGGISRNLPAPDAAALGADIVICSDVTEPLATADSLVTLVDVASQALAYRMVERRDRDARWCDVLIRPDIKGIASADFGRSDLIIERGAEAARAALESLRALGVAGLVASGPSEPDPSDEPFRVTEVRVSGLVRMPVSRVLQGLAIRAGDTVDVRDVTKAVNRVYDTGMFQRVSYRMERPAYPDPADSAARVMDIRVVDRGRSWVGVGYRYEGRYKASILGTAAVRNLLVRGSTLLADLRLGEQTRLAAEFQERLGGGIGPLFSLRADYRRSPFDLYDEGDRVAEPRVKELGVEAFAGLGIGYSADIGIVGKFDDVEADNAPLFPDWAAGDQSFVTLGGVLRIDTMERLAFPRSGIAVLARAEWGSGASGGEGTFSQRVMDVRGSAPLTERISLTGRAVLGTSSGESLPPNYLFLLGGANDFYLYPDRHFSFSGLRVQEARGRHAQLLDLGVQWEFLRDVYALGHWNAASLPQEWGLAVDEFFTGFGVGVGALTRAGAAELLVTGGSVADAVRVELDVGFQF